MSDRPSTGREAELRAALASWPRPAPAPRMRRVWQMRRGDCGPAALAMVVRALGGRTTIAAARAAAGATRAGTSLVGLVKGARELGLDAEMVEIDVAHVGDLPVPAILHWDGRHWVVLETVGPEVVEIFDPGRGRRRVSHARLAECWSGYAAIFAQAPAPPDANRPRG